MVPFLNSDTSKQNKKLIKKTPEGPNLKKKRKHIIIDIVLIKQTYCIFSRNCTNCEDLLRLHKN